MGRSPFGWSYPPGCSGPPEDPEADLAAEIEDELREALRRATRIGYKRHEIEQMWAEEAHEACIEQAEEDAGEEAYARQLEEEEKLFKEAWDRGEIA